jgi:hypothetical protein
MRTRTPILLLSALSPVALHAAVPETIQFNRDVRPILSEKCFGCHGMDAKNRKGDRRLDTAEDAAAEKDGVRAIVPGDPLKSDAWTRILSTDKEEVMPPPKFKKVLTAEERETIRRWIEQGATYQKHWAFETPQRATPPETSPSAVPPSSGQAGSQNPIDRFVSARLASAGLAPAAESDRRTLARRLSLDLTGLPPATDEVEAFVSDPSPNAYEKLVDRWMQKPQWGEHRARYWLDAARYADTHGLHFDNYREMWPYRDWVISAFNRNLSFDQFTVEQIAGDLLPAPTREQLIATGFHRCNATTNEGGTIPEEVAANYANDRVTTTAWVWLGLTANCAACHDHKFDPVSTKDFYAMAAFFRNTTQSPMDGNVHDTKPVVYLPRPEDELRFAALGREIPPLRDALQRRKSTVGADFTPWLAAAQGHQMGISPKELLLHLPLNEGAGNIAHGASRSQAFQVETAGPVDWKAGGRLGSAPVFSASSHLVVANHGDFERDKPFSLGTWVFIPKSLGRGVIAGNLPSKSPAPGWELSVDNQTFTVQLSGETGSVRAATKPRTTRQDQWQHVVLTYDGSGKASGLHLFLNGRNQELKPTSDDLQSSIRSSLPLRLGQRDKQMHLADGQLQDFRLYGRELSSGEARWLPELQKVQVAFAQPVEKRSPAHQATLLEFYLETLDPEFTRLTTQVEDLDQELALLRGRSTVSHIQEEKTTPAMAHILMRGAYNKPGDEVQADTFSALHPFPQGAPRNRLGLARWLVAPENPLTARVTVNRFWQELFGTGLVRTSEDLGTQGEPPSHPELLDWLAVEFRDSGWDVKKLFRLMLTSSTYRQSAEATPEKLEKDPQNRMLSRGPRFRMDAEMIRDYALSTSGLLVSKVGGPSVRPYQPEGVWEAVAMPGSDTRLYKRESGDALYRRSLYTFWKRAAPPASLDILNAPSRENCTVRRERTNTPLQALVTLNDPQFVEAARKLAEEVLKQHSENLGAALAEIAARTLQRPLEPAEIEVALRTAESLEHQFALHPESAAAFLNVGDAKPDPRIRQEELAALTLVANQFLNLDEALCK